MQDFIAYYNHRITQEGQTKQRNIEQRLRYNLGRWNQKPRVELKLKP
jgi:hypothetical protein